MDRLIAILLSFDACTLWAAGVAAMLQLIDLGSTSIALRDPRNYESNPIVAFFMDTLPGMGWMIAKTIFAFAGIFALLANDAAVLLWVLNLLYALVLTRNIYFALR